MPEPTIEEVREVFNHWVEIVKNRPGKKAPTRPVVLGPKREHAIRQALKLYGVQTCKDAIEGVLYSDWHMGNNPRGKTYDDITLILRNEVTIERFLAHKDEHDEQQEVEEEWDNVTFLKRNNN